MDNERFNEDEGCNAGGFSCNSIVTSEGIEDEAILEELHGPAKPQDKLCMPFILPLEEFRQFQRDYYMMKKEGRINLVDGSKVKYAHRMADTVKLQMVLLSELYGRRQELTEFEKE